MIQVHMSKFSMVFDISSQLKFKTRIFDLDPKKKKKDGNLHL